MRNFLQRMLLIAALVVPWATPMGSAQAQGHFSCDFESAAEDASWTLANGSAGNYWAIGNAVAAGGSRSLYITNGSGASYSGSAATVYAYQEFEMLQGAGTISYSWMCNGESSYDNGRLYLVPASTSLSGSASNINTAPTGAIALFSGNYFQGSSAWNNVEDFSFTVPADGTYRLVVMWHNDGSVYYTPGMCIDNIEMNYPSAVGADYCFKPTGLTVVQNFADLTATFSWNEARNADEETLYVITVKDHNGVIVAGTTQEETTWTIEDAELSLNELYTVEVMTQCGEGNLSDPVSATFMFYGAPYVELFDDLSVFPTSWTKIYSSSTSYPSITSSNTPHTGKHMNLSGSQNIVALPRLVSDLSTLQLHFWLKNASSSYNPTLRVGVATSLPGSSLQGWTYDTLVAIRGTEATTTYRDYTVYLAQSEFSEGYIILDFEGGNVSAGMYLDDIEITTAPLCTPPVAIRALATDVAINLSWMELGQSDSWYVEWDTAGFSRDDVHQSQTASETHFTIEDLQPNTFYDIYLSSICSATESSVVVGPITVKTECAFLHASDLPYSQGFEGGVPSCWSLSALQEAGTPHDWAETTAQKHSGSRSIYVQDQSETNRHLIATQPIVVEEGDSIYVTYWQYRYNDSYNTKYNEGVRIWANTVPNDTVGGQVLSYVHRHTSLSPAIVGGVTDWYQYETAPIALTGTVYIIFEGINEYGGASYIDDVVIRRISSCKRVENAHMVEATPTSATLAWDYPLTNAQSFTIAYAPAATFNVDDASTYFEVTTDNAETTFLLTGTDEDPLLDMTNYKFAVRANCGDDVYGDWSAVATFSTQADCGDQSFRDVVLGTGTSTTYYTPAYTYYSQGSTYYSHGMSWSIYTSDELAALDIYPGTIKTLGYQGAADFSFNAKVFMKMDNRSTFASYYDTISRNDMTLVYNGTINVANGDWSDFVLQNPFEYTGEGNLVVLVVRDADITPAGEGVSYLSGNVKYTSASNKVIYQFGTNSPNLSYYRPNIRLQMCVTEPLCFNVFSAQVESTTAETATLTYTEDPRNAERGLTTGHMVYAVVNNATAAQFDPFAPEAYTGEYVSELLTGETLTIGNLNANTPYVFYVVAVCGDETGALYATTTGRTGCAAWDLPFTTTFANDEIGATTGFDVFCWQRLSTNNTTPSITTLAANARTNNALQFNVMSAAAAHQNSMAVLPQVLSDYPINNAQLSFWAKKSSMSAAANLIIGVLSDPQDTNTFEQVGIITIDTTIYKEYKINLTDYEGEGQYVAIKVTNAPAAHVIYVDDVTLRVKPGCEKPTQLACDEEEISAHDALLTWADENDEVMGFQVVYKPCANFNEAAALDFNLDTNTYLYDMVDASADAFEGFTFANAGVELRASTIYAIAVRAMCDGEHTSQWSNAIVVTTTCAPIADIELPWTDNFEGAISYSTNGTSAPAGYSPTNLDHIISCYEFPTLNTNAKAYITVGQAANGNASLALVSTNNSPVVAVLPEFDAQIAALQMGYSYKATAGTLLLGFYADGEFTAIDTLALGANFQRFDHLYSIDEVDFPEGAKLAFCYTNAATSVSTNAVCYIDSLVVSQAATCAKPINFVVNQEAGVGAYNINLQWKNGPVGDATAWDIETSYTANNATVTNIIPVANLTPSEEGVFSYNLQGLLANTNYTLRLRSNCGEEDGVSDWCNTVIRQATKNDANYIASFTTAGIIGQAVIDSVNHTVTLSVVYGTPVDAMTATMTVSAGATAYVGTTPWSNYAANDYTNGLQVTVKSADPTIFQVWTINVNFESCTTPTAIAFSDVQRRSFVASWTNPDASVAAHELLLSETALTEAELENAEPIVVEGVNSYVFEHLMRNNEYHVYVRALCGDNQSRWLTGVVNTKNLGFYNCDEIVNDTLGTDATTNQYVPSYSLYNYSYSQQLFKAEELLPTTINQIGIKCTGAIQRDVEMYLTTTNAANMNSWVTMDAQNTVKIFDGNIGTTTGWQTIVLDNPYDYDGVSNLVLTVVDNSGEWTGGLSYAGNDQSFTASRYYYSDGTHYTYYDQPSTDGTSLNFRMMVAIQHCGEDFACPDVRDLHVAYDNDDVTHVTLSWAADGDYAFEYDFFVSESEMTPEQLAAGYEAGTAMNAMGVTSYTVSNLAPYTWYNFYIRVQCNEGGVDDGISGWSHLRFRTNAACRTPKDLAVEYTSKTSAVISWTGDEVQDNNFQYILSTTEIPSPENYPLTMQGLQTESVTLNNLVPGQHYYFYLANSCGADGMSPYVPFEFDMVSACPAPVQLAFSGISAMGAQASWSRNEALFAEETEWQVTWYPVEGGADPISMTVTEPSCNITRVLDGTTYTVEVAAICNGNVGETVSANVTFPVFSACNTIGTGTSGSASYVVNDYYRNSYVQSIFTADEVPAGNILSIAVQYNDAVSPSTCDNVHIYMGTTSKSSFSGTTDWENATNLVEVWSGSFNEVSQGWNTFTLTTPYSYSGNGNLIVAFDKQASSYASSRMFAYSNAGATRTLYYANDGSAWSQSASGTTTSSRANMQFCFEAGGCLPVDHLTVSNITSNTADAAWYSSVAADNFEVVIAQGALSEAELEAAQKIEVAETRFAMNDLVTDRDYRLYVRPICGEESANWTSVQFHTTPTCSAPSIRATIASDDTITLMVAHNGEYGEAETFEYQITGVSDPTFSYTFVGGDSVVYTGLPFMADYTWRVRSICGEGDSSQWTNGQRFHICGTVQIPFAESFINSGANQSGSYSCWTKLSGYASTSNGRVNIYSNGKYASPRFATDLHNATVTFQAQAYSSNGTGSFQIGVMSDLNDIETYQPLVDLTYGAAQLYEVALNDYEFEGQYIVFTALSGADFYLGPVSVDYTPECRRPISFQLAAAAQNAYSVDLKWEQPNDVMAWMLFDTISGQTFQIPVAVADINGKNVNFTLAGLAPNTSYVFGIYAICDNGNSDTAANLIAVTTLNDEATFTAFAIRDAQVGVANIDNVNHIIEATVRADADITSLVPTFAITSGAQLKNDLGEVLASGANAYDFTYGQYFYLQPSGRDVEATEWEVRVAFEGCASMYDLRANEPTRTSIELAWNIADSNVNEFHMIISDRSLTARQLATASYETIVVEGEGTARTYTIDNLDRNTTYYFYLRNSCAAAWMNVSATTKALLDCETYQIGNSTQSGGYYLPYSYYYHSSVTHQLYTAEEIGTEPGQISAIAFNRIYAGNAGKHIAIYMANTNQTSMTTALASNQFQLVYTPKNVDFPMGWYTLDFDNPFNWTGGSVVVAVVADNTYENGYSSSSLFATTSVSNRALYVQTDGSAYTITTAPTTSCSYRNDVRFTVCHNADPCAQVADVEAEYTTNSADLTWTASESDFFGYYDVLLSETEIADFETIDSLESYTYTGSANACSFADLTQNTHYYVYLRARCNANGHDDGYSVWTLFEFTTIADCPSVTNLAAETTSPFEATITWNAPAEFEGAYAYVLTNEALSQDDIAALTSDDFEDLVEETEIQLENLEAGSTYYVYVASVCDEDAETISEWRSVHFTLAPACPAPINLAVSDVTALAATFAWERGLYGEEEAWTITLEYVPADDTIATTLDIAATSTTTIVTLPQAETTYRAWVSANCGGENGLAGDTITFAAPAAISGSSDCITIGEGSGSSYNTPFNDYYGNSYTQQIYLADEIGQGGLITSLAIDYAGTLAPESCTDVTVYMGVTSATDMSAGWISHDNLVEVYSGDFSGIVNGWNTIELAEPFMYDGMSNLVVAFDKRSDDYNSSSSTFHYTAHANGSRAYASDSYPMDIPGLSEVGTLYAFRPDMQFCITASGDCGRVARVVASNITTTSARVAWYPSAEGETSYMYLLSHTALRGDELVEAMSQATFVEGLSVELTDLDVDADYYFYLSPVCFAGDPIVINSVFFQTAIMCEMPQSAEAVVNEADGMIYFNTVAAEGTEPIAFDIQIWAAGSTDTISIDGAAASETMEMAEFEGNTYYNWRVRAVCDETGENNSRWLDCEPFSFCAALNAPYTEAFGNLNDNPLIGCMTIGWNNSSVIDYSSTYKPGFVISNGDTSLRMYGGKCYSNDGYVPFNSTFVLPQFVDDLNTLKVSANITALSYSYGRIMVGTMSSARDLSTFHPAAVWAPGVTNTTMEFSAMLENAPEDDHYIAFRTVDSTDGYAYYIYLDDIHIWVPERYTLTTEVNFEEMGSVEGAGEYVEDTRVRMEAIPEIGYHFVQWNDQNTSAVRYITMNGNKSFTAYFDADMYTVNVASIDTNMGIVTTTAEEAGYGAQVDIEAIANEHAYFVMWSDGDSNAARTIEITDDTYLIAFFAKDSFNVVATTNVEGIEVLGTGIYAYGDEATLVAPEVYGAEFANWSNDIDTNVYTFTVTEDVELVANYVAAQFRLAIGIEGNGTVEGAGLHDYMSEITLTATPAEGAYFNGWSDGEINAERLYTVYEDDSLTAYFVDSARYAINVYAANEQFGSVTGSGIYSEGAEVVISATPVYGYHFISWNDGDTNAERTIIATENADYTATFAINTYNVTIAYAAQGLEALGTIAIDSVEGFTTTVDHGQMVTLRAMAQTGRKFMGWSNQVMDTVYTFAVVEDVNLTANFGNEQYEVRLMASPYAGGTVAGDTVMDFMSRYSISATANYGYTFAMWSDSNINAQRTGLLAEDLYLTAIFVPDTFTVTLASGDIAMGTVSESGVAAYNSYFTARATANYGYSFVKWSDNNTSAYRSIRVKGDTNLVAEFAPMQYNLTVRSGNNSFGTVTGTGTYDYLANATITATPRAGFDFVMWNDSVEDATRTVQVTGNATYTAIFAPATAQYTVALQSNDETMGTVAGAGQYVANSLVTISANPNATFRFVKWSDNNTMAVRSLRVSADTLLTAFFEPDTHYLAVRPAVANQGTTTGAGQYVDSTVVTISATPAFGYHFVRWIDNDTNATRTFTFDHNARTTYIAYFAADRFNVTVAMEDSTLGRVTGAGNYLFDTEHQIAAIDTNLEDAYTFASWNDGNTENPRTITVNGNMDFIAIFADTNSYYTINVEANVAERGTVEGAGNFRQGAIDTLKAHANAGFEFVQWNDGNTDSVRAITVGANATFIAQFDTTSYNVTLFANAQYGTVQGAGRYIAGRTAEISATATRAGYHFTKWSDNDTNNPRMIVVDSDTALTAEFAIDVLHVTVSVNNPAMGTVTGITNGDYNYGTYIAAVANANYGYEFQSWSNGETGVRFQTTLTEDLDLVANFGLRQYTINAAAEVAERGTVEGAGAYDFMTSATLQAVAAYGYHFTGWLGNNGSVISTENPMTVVVNGPNSYLAQFEANDYTVTVASNDTTMGTVTPATTTAAYLSEVELSAAPVYGYVFNGWSDGISDNPRVLTVLSDSALTANFVPGIFTINVVAADTTLGTVTGSGEYAYGTVQTITAVPADETSLSFWYWNDGDTSATRQITVLGDATYTATFGAHAYRVSVVADHGTVQQTNNGMLIYGAIDTIAVTADYGYVFTGWSDGNTDNPRYIEVLDNATLTAQFAKDSFNVVLAANDATLGTVAGAGRYEYEQAVVISANAAEHYHFVSWNDGDTINPRTITVMGDTAFTANFEIDAFTVALNVNEEGRGTVRGAGVYDYNHVVTLTATAAYGYQFAQWSNGVTVTPYALTVVSDTTLTAIFTPAQFAISAVSNDTAMGTVAGAGSYAYLDTISLEATANYGYHFVRWNDGNTQNPRTVEVTGVANYTAYFAANTYELALVADSTMGTVAGAGEFTYLSTVTFSATANTGYHFVSWNDGDTNATRSIVLTADTQFTAQFAANIYTITVATNDANLGTVTGGGEYHYGDQVVLTATATATNRFANWTDGNAENPRTITVTGDATYTAFFVHDAQTYTVTLNVNDPVMGHTEGAGSYVEGSVVTVKAIANAHYEFDSWSDGNTDAIREVVVNSNITLTANFVATQYMITVTANDATMGTVTGTGSYAYNTTATITATANNGYRFVKWSDDNTDATRTVTVLGDAEYQAIFERIPTQGIDDVDANVVIYSTNGNIVVKGAANQSIYIYDAVGRCVNHVAINNSEVNEFAMTTSGVYMVKVGNMPARRVVVVR